MDTDEKIAYLLELFPDSDPEDLFNLFVANNNDIDLTIRSILALNSSESDNLPSSSAFDHLVSTFPDVDVEAIEAFLLTQNENQMSNNDEITREFMKQTEGNLQKSSHKRQNNLKMTLSDFAALLKTSQDQLIRNASTQKLYSDAFEYTFLETDDVNEFKKLESLTGQQVRKMAADLQSDRIENLQKSINSYKPNNLSGMSRASYYSDQGHSLAPRIKMLNRIAAEIIFKSKNPNFKTIRTIDLHHLTVSEAQSVTCAYLQHHENIKTPSVQIITGKGNHSQGGNCKLAAAIWNILRARKNKFSFDGTATFTINLR